MKKISNKTLLIILAVLAVVVLAFYLYDSHRGERSFREDIISVDSSKVSTITIYPKIKDRSQPFSLVRAGRGWNIRSGTHSWPADTMAVAQLISSLRQVRAERVAVNDSRGWKDFEITDSLSIRVVVEQGNEAVADFRVGKASFSMSPDRSGRNRNFSIKSNLRIKGDDRVYAADSYLSVMINGQTSGYRNRTVVKLDPSRVDRLSFIYPGDSSFMLSRDSTHWLLNDRPADSASAMQWLNSVANTVNTDFAEDGTWPFAFPFTLKIEGKNMAVVEVQGAPDPATGKYFVRSSANTSAVFGSASSQLFNQMFPGKAKFLAPVKTEKKAAKKPVRK